MDESTATLIAACIAATAAVAKLFFDRFSENRESFRILLEPVITELGDSIYGTVACCDTMLKAKTPQSFGSWHTKAIKEREKLKSVRPKARYPLWGLDEGIRVLIKLPDWVSHCRSNPKRAQDLLKHASNLRHMIDITAMRCFRNGRTPDLTEIWQVYYHAWRCRRIFDGGKKI